VICLGVDPTDPRSKRSCIYSVGDERKRELLALGTLERGRECEELVEVIERHHVEAVAIEYSEEVYFGGQKQRQRAKQGKGPQENETKRQRELVRALLAQNLLAGQLFERSKQHLTYKQEVVLIDAPSWRGILGVRLQHDPITGEPSETYDAAVHRAIRMWIRNWPASSTEHERDATGVWLGAFMAPRAKAIGGPIFPAATQLPKR
jgi:hypothetical protein